MSRARSTFLAAACVAGVTISAAPASAQNTAAPPPAAPAQTPTGPALPLSMDQAVAMALEHNLGLKAERLNPEIAAHQIAAARSFYLPFVQSGISRNSTKQQGQRNADGTETVPSSTRFSGNASLGQNLRWYGGGVSVSWSGNRQATAGSQSTFNPTLGSQFQITFTQPLWQDFRIDQGRASLQRAERQKVITDLGLEQRVVATETTVRAAYLNLLASIEGRKVAELNMELTETSLRNAQARVKVGQSPQIEIVTAEAAVESNRDQVIQATARVAAAEDNLRSLILDPSRPDYWTVSIVPTDKIEVTSREINVDAAIANALANRLDLLALKRNMEITDLNMELNRNLTRPSVDLRVDYSASAAGGRQTSGDGSLTRGFGPVLEDVFGGAYPSWTFGVTVGYPLGRSSAEAAVAQNAIQKRQQELSVRELELSIAQDVRQAARDVQTSFQRVQAARAFLAAAQRQLDAEDQKFAVGLSDTFNLQLRQRELASARNAELNAMIAYNNALIQFERVQKIQ
jgi:outer membrane protein TolC